MKSKIKTMLCTSVLLTTAVANTAMAMDQGDWLIRAGASYIDPKSNNHEIVSVDSATSFTFNVSYFMTEAWAVELLAAWPFKHDLELKDGTKIGDTKHLPPTLSIQYHWAPNSVFQPYVGVGLNFTTFFSEDLYGPLEGVDLDLGNSWGLAGEIGADIKLSDQWFLNLSVRYMDIETKAKLDGESIGKVDISPWIYGGNVGFRF
ncbi:MAG: outer membrane beta-barrel protein [Xanthomonadales bacterium]|nr:outer membrane beta-barrel protein [Xanthomonadales bacterium]MDH3926069.1 outer membrane beta-barrel protein [Xanthomonadales bacterium]MDH3940136.1 outer membrane beta-barrel protein [Xanthomonadales bacterium]MDH4002352.1 outer membrane beta-barrel protein [Xanthomonadales bacterium]